MASPRAIALCCGLPKEQREAVAVAECGPEFAQADAVLGRAIVANDV